MTEEIVITAAEIMEGVDLYIAQRRKVEAVLDKWYGKIDLDGHPDLVNFFAAQEIVAALDDKV